ncbi:MAG: CpaD family pilus assembly protein [Parvularculaceae bacterium]
MIRIKSKVLAAALLAMSAAGCSLKSNGADVAIDPRDHHPIAVDAQVVTLTLKAESPDAGLTDLDRARIRGFAVSYINNGHGPVTVTSSTGAAGRNVAAEAREALNRSGLAYESIASANYAASDAVNGDVILSFSRYVATSSACGVWEGLDERRSRNLQSPNFGCFAQKNLAAMIGDPRDLLTPADSTPPDAPFRIRGVESFREGEITSSDTDDEINVDVSE